MFISISSDERVIGKSDDRSTSCMVFHHGVSNFEIAHYEELKLTLIDYKTEVWWLDYPHKFIPYGLKMFYLLQASYWSQQAILLAAGIEKPRKDFKVFVAHVSTSHFVPKGDIADMDQHFVTLYLIFWSYMTYVSLYHSYF